MKKILLLILVLVAVGAAVAFYAQRQSHASAQAPKRLYTCSMHPQIVQDKPGNCPICGMTLTPKVEAPKPVAAKQLYTCGMHPQIVQDKPGNCPICGMKLTPLAPQASEHENAIAIDGATRQKMNLRVDAVTEGPVVRTVRTFGALEAAEPLVSTVTTKISGWIEKLLVASTGETVKAGAPLFEIYSSELYAAQVEYLTALRAAREAGLNDPELLEGARLKLKYFDISDAQIAALEKSGQPTKTLRVHAPRDGVVLEKMAVDGMRVDMGMPLYRIASLDTLWLVAQVYEKDLPFVHAGQSVELSFSGHKAGVAGKVEFVYPTVDEATRTGRVRVRVENDGSLRPGMYATAVIRAEVSPEAVLVPDMAVLRTGERNVVFVALEDGLFEPRDVKLGARTEGGLYQVLGGLSAGERVVTSGQFMLDSESQLREALRKMMKPGTGPGHEGHGATPSGAPQAGASGSGATMDAGHECCAGEAGGGTAGTSAPATAAPPQPKASAKPALPAHQH